MPTNTALPMNYPFPATVVVDSADQEYDQATTNLSNGYCGGIVRERDADDYDDVPMHEDANAKNHSASEAEDDNVLCENKPQ